MSVEAPRSPVRIAGPRRRLRLEHVVMGGADALPDCCNGFTAAVVTHPWQCSPRTRPGPGELRRGLERAPVHRRADEFAHPRRPDGAVQPRHRSFTGLGGEPHRYARQAIDLRSRPRCRTSAAVPHRDRLRLSAEPEAGLVNRSFATDRTSAPNLRHPLHAGSRLRHGASHLSVRLLLAASALQSVDASYEEAAQILGAGPAGGRPSPVTLPLVAPAVLAGGLPGLRQCDRPLRLAGDHRTAWAGSSRCRPGSTRCSTTRRATAWRPRCHWSSSPITVVALALQRRYLARRSYVTLGGKGARPATRCNSARCAGCCSAFCRARLRRGDCCCHT